MNDYHLQELLTLAQSWDLDQLNTYIEQLEQRVKDTRNLIRELSNLKKRRTKYDKVKETGIRSG